VTVFFELRTLIAASVDAMFDLSLSVDAHVGSMADSGERAVVGVTHGLISLGEEVTWKARHFGLPFTMTSRITELERPRRFVDEQVHGPFQRFHHEHLFEPDDGSTLMIDRVNFDAPLGPLGRIAERAVLGSYLPKLIQDRNEYLKRTAETARP
jgi:ligand-binding SRPBCC domain-containing protein